MPNFQNFTTKAKEAIRKAHELAIERGQNHVSPVHLLTALALQDESTVIAILDRLDIDIIAFTDHLLEALESPEVQSTISQSYQLYLTPELAKPTLLFVESSTSWLCLVTPADLVSMAYCLVELFHLDLA